MRAITSAKLIPAAATSIRTPPASSGGSGRSCTASTLGGPCLVMTTARTRESLYARASAQVDGPTVDEARRGDDLLDDVRRDERVGRDDHRGDPLRGAGAAAIAVRRVPDGGRGDVDAVLAEERADA